MCEVEAEPRAWFQSFPRDASEKLPVFQDPQPHHCAALGFALSFCCALPSSLPRLRKYCCVTNPACSPRPSLLGTGVTSQGARSNRLKRLPRREKSETLHMIWPLDGASLLENKAVYVTDWQFEWLGKCHSLKIKMKLSVNSNRSKLKSRPRHLFREYNSAAVFGISK